MLPIRCFTCNKILGCYTQILEELGPEMDFQKFYETYHIKRYCCRKILLTHIDVFALKPDFPHENIIYKNRSETTKIVFSK